MENMENTKNTQDVRQQHSLADIRQMALIGLMTAVICIIAPFSLHIPVSPVPISLAIFAVCITTYILGLKKGLLCTLLYIVIGLAGVPVFSGFSSGPSVLFGPTGGYLAAYILIVLCEGFCVDRFRSKPWTHVVGMVVGIALCYFCGTIRLAQLNSLSFSAAFAAGVIPFIPGDIAKVIIVMIIGPQVYKALIHAKML